MVKMKDHKIIKKNKKLYHIHLGADIDYFKFLTRLEASKLKSKDMQAWYNLVGDVVIEYIGVFIDANEFYLEVVEAY
jgi:hypothetical protein